MISPVPPASAVTPAHRRLLAAGMLCYGFDALDFMMLAMAMPLLIAEWHLTLGQAGLLGTAGMIGVDLRAIERVQVPDPRSLRALGGSRGRAVALQRHLDQHVARHPLR